MDPDAEQPEVLVPERWSSQKYRALMVGGGGPVVVMIGSCPCMAE